MAYSATAVLMLISAPADVPDQDMATVKRTVSQWNWNTGRPARVTVVPISWSEHAVSQFGARPQAILNDQLVDETDMAVALFADRLGTPTGTADSGTLEEIDRLVEAGKHVSIFVNQAPRALSGEAAVAEKARLEAALTLLRQRAIVLTYADQATLAGHLNNMLSMAAGKVTIPTPSGSGLAVDSESVGVWPHVVSEQFQETDRQGHLKTRNRHYVELRNQTGRPVFDVSFALPEDAADSVMGVGEVLPRMAPGALQRYDWMPAMGDPLEMICTVTWNFQGEEPRETKASLRL